jgi:Zn finger protein HypA/HybF involved in hydrogenase expression
MARFRCRGCGEESTFDYTGRHDCPKCSSDNVQFELSIEELEEL